MYRGFALDVAYGGLREVEGRAQWPDVAQDAAVRGVPAQEGELLAIQMHTRGGSQGLIFTEFASCAQRRVRRAYKLKMRTQ
jgi:hypothetical protein